MATYTEVIDAGPGWTKVRDEAGNVYTVKGDRNWRNNNPGNIEYGPFTQSHGAIGSDGRFAVFPDYETGRAAKESLLFDSPSYSGKTISGAINRYAPSFENNTSSYINSVANAIGVSADTPLSDLTPAQRNTMLDAMQRVEGFRPGSIFASDGTRLPPQDVLGYAPQPLMRPAEAAAAGVAAQQPKPKAGVLSALWEGMQGGVGALENMAQGQLSPVMRAAQRVDPKAEIMKRINPLQVALYMMGNHATPIQGSSGLLNPITQRSTAWLNATGNNQPIMRAASAPALVGAAGVRGQNGRRDFGNRTSDGVARSLV